MGNLNNVNQLGFCELANDELMEVDGGDTLGGLLLGIAVEYVSHSLTGKGVAENLADLNKKVKEGIIDKILTQTICFLHLLI